MQQFTADCFALEMDDILAHSIGKSSLARVLASPSWSASVTFRYNPSQKHLTRVTNFTVAWCNECKRMGETVAAFRTLVESCSCSCPGPLSFASAMWRTAIQTCV